MKRRRITKAKLFIGKADGTWEEVTGVTIGPCAFEVERPADAPAEIPRLRDFEMSFDMYDLKVSPLVAPPIGSDPTRN